MLSSKTLFNVSLHFGIHNPSSFTSQVRANSHVQTDRQPHRSTCSLDVVILSHPPSSSSLKVNNRSFSHASPCLWNQLPKELRLPADHEDLTLSSDLTHVSSSFLSSPLSPSITPSLFHFWLKTHLFHKSFPP